MNDETQKLYKALENETNVSIMKLSTKKIKEHKNNILQQLQISGKELKNYHKKLKKYRYCSEISDLQNGFFIRWISLTNPNHLFLTKGAYLIDVEIYKKGIQLYCKGFGGIFFRVKFDEVAVFQKLSDQESFILNILDYLDK